MTKISDILPKAKKKLIAAKIDNYALDADLLLCKAANITRERIIGYPESEISDDNITVFNQLIERRIKREPISHILGMREFWGMDFKVTKDTLAPRADSETLIEAALEHYNNKRPPENIIDFGTGTGCLLLSLLSEFEDAKGIGIDISEDTIKVAKENSCKLGLAKRTSFVVNNWGIGIKGKYDLIISNPPYIKNDDSLVLEPEVVVYEPDNALYGGKDGLECYVELAPFVSSLISENGIAIIEFGIGQHNQVKEIMEKSGLKFTSFKKDLAGIIRCIVLSA